MVQKKKLSKNQTQEFLALLRERFNKNMKRHKEVEWSEVEARLQSQPKKLWSLYEMERTGGQPDVVDMDKDHKAVVFIDCAAESPSGRRKICYDREGLESRKQHKPDHNAVDMAADMGVELLNEEQYRRLQEMDEFDLKTSSWILTPDPIRKLGGALFADRRYNHVFIYHNGAHSYYGARGFRACLKI